LRAPLFFPEERPKVAIRLNSYGQRGPPFYRLIMELFKKPLMGLSYFGAPKTDLANQLLMF